MSSPPDAPADVPDDALDEATLRAVEQTAAELAAAGGAMLLDRFRTTLEVRFKDQHGADPVTDVDQAVEDLVRDGVQARFPDHAVLGEEREDRGPAAADFVWVVDPLDGTSNFINGLATFACSIGVLWRGAPIVGALFLPTSRHLAPGVYHSRRGAGVRFNDEPFTFQPAATAAAGRLSGLPGGTGGVSGPRGRRFGVVRTLGSIAAELAFTAEGTLHMSVFEGAHIWDVAGGVALCLEAGAVVYQRPSRAAPWRPLERFAGSDGAPPTVATLRAWNQSLAAGDPAVLPQLAADLKQEQGARAVLRRVIRREES